MGGFVVNKLRGDAALLDPGLDELEARTGVPVLGVCGGYQMLGEAVRDPDRVESDAAVAPGLGLLPVVTTFARDKTTVRVRARVTAAAGNVAGSYLHGLFANDERLADAVERAVDLPRVAKLAGLAFPKS